MTNNIIRRIKLIYKNAQRSESPEVFIKDSFAKLGFYYPEYGWGQKKLLRALNYLPSKTRRSLFKVFRAVAKRGERIDLFELFSIWATPENRRYKKLQPKEYLESLKQTKFGDFRLLLTQEQIKQKALDLLNSGYFKIVDNTVYFYVGGKILFTLNGYGQKRAIERASLNNWDWNFFAD